MKKITFLFATVILIAFLAFSASALVETGQCGDNVFWNFDDNSGILIISGKGKIEEDAFWYNSNSSKIKEVIIEDGITSIGKYSFRDCYNIERIAIPNSVKSIGEWAFHGCSNLTNIIIPNSVTSIGGSAFDSCYSLTNITLSNNLKTIEYQTFSQCHSLISITIPNSVTSIDYNAFSSCTSLTDITLPDSVVSIGDGAFMNCHSLTTMNLPNSVTSIGDCVFTWCDSLTSIIIPKGINRIGYNTFECCYNLKNVTIPNNVISIASNAFAGCEKLEVVNYNGTQNQWENIEIDSTGNEYIINATIHYSNNINILDKEFNKNIDYYTNYWNSSVYNAELANMLALASTAVYDENSIRNFYSSLKFDVFELCDYDGVYDPGSCGYAIGFKVSEFNNEIICLIAIRGSSNISDWVGNILLQTNEEEKHIGFASPAVRIYNKISEMMQNNHLSKNIKYVITGHSRGAAVGNLLSVKLIENGVSLSNVYNYNFACPDVACKIAFPYYDNIFNFCNIKDVVPFLPGELANSFVTPGTYWSKYGRTYWFSENPKDENDMFAAHDMKLYLEYFDQKPVLSQLHYDLDTVKDYSDNGIVVKVCCPVDVIVMDTEGNNIASVIDGEINYYDSTFGDVIILTDGDKKVIYISGDRDFNITLTGTDNGTMTYSLEKYNLITNEVSESKTFTNVELEPGKEMYSPVSIAETTEDVELFVVRTESEDKVNTHIINTDGTETEINHTYVPSVTPPTCTEVGVITYTCSCSDSYMEVIPKTGHKDADGDYICDNNCGYEYEKPEELTPDTPDVPDEPTDDACDHLCHKNGFMGFIWKIIVFFQKLFKINPVCGCGVSHY